MPIKMDYRCVRCGAKVPVPPDGEGSLACEDCGFVYRYGKNYLQYDFEKLLFQRFNRRYLLHKVLHNNASLAYQRIQVGSLSLPEREDVVHFRNYLFSHLRSGRILDVGCGILEWPGYIDCHEKAEFEFYGIDPIDDRSFRGVRVTGCAEFLPFDDGFFDGLIYATSLDHVCSLEQTIREAYRVLSNKGKLMVWTADFCPSWKGMIMNKARQFMRRLCNPGSLSDEVSYLRPGTSVRVGSYAVYPDLSVFYVPCGAVDPFHASHENPQEIIALMKRAPFKLLNIEYRHRDEVFLCFQKDATAKGKK